MLKTIGTFFLLIIATFMIEFLRTDEFAKPHALDEQCKKATGSLSGEMEVCKLTTQKGTSACFIKQANAQNTETRSLDCKFFEEM